MPYIDAMKFLSGDGMLSPRFDTKLRENRIHDEKRKLLMLKKSETNLEVTRYLADWG